MPVAAGAWLQALLGKIAPWLLVALAFWLYGQVKHNAGELEERGKWETKVAKADNDILRLNVALAKAPYEATQKAMEKYDAREPIILHDRETVMQFAATPEGAVRCLGPERVLGIEASAPARGLAYSAAAEAGNTALHADALPKVP